MKPNQQSRAQLPQIQQTKMQKRLTPTYNPHFIKTYLTTSSNLFFICFSCPSFPISSSLDSPPCLFMPNSYSLLIFIPLYSSTVDLSFYLIQFFYLEFIVYFRILMTILLAHLLCFCHLPEARKVKLSPISVDPRVFTNFIFNYLSTRSLKYLNYLSILKYLLFLQPPLFCSLFFLSIFLAYLNHLLAILLVYTTQPYRRWLGHES